MAKKYVEVELVLDDDLLLRLCIMAHEQNITLNTLVCRLLAKALREKS